jgi:hypothetical protein
LTYPVRVDASDHGITFFAFANRTVIHAQFLSNETDNPAQLRSEIPGEGQLVSHAVVLEEQDA